MSKSCTRKLYRVSACVASRVATRADPLFVKPFCRPSGCPSFVDGNAALEAERDRRSVFSYPRAQVDLSTLVDETGSFFGVDRVTKRRNPAATVFDFQLEKQC